MRDQQLRDLADDVISNQDDDEDEKSMTMDPPRLKKCKIERIFMVKFIPFYVI